MNKFSALAVATALLGVVGCTGPIPLPTGHEKSFQPKMLAAQHWNSLAQDVAQRLQGALAGEGASPVLFLQRPSSNTTFYASFHEMLETQLLQQGFGVTRVPANADLRVEYSLRHAGDADYPARTTSSEVEPPDDDILITVAVLNGDRYVTRINEIFYVDETSHGEYFAARPPAPGRLIEVVGE